MTNYTRFPYKRSGSGFTIKFSDYQYSWSQNTKAQRKYLRESDYCSGSLQIYVGIIDCWMSESEFRDFCDESNYAKRVKDFNGEKNEYNEKCILCGNEMIFKQGTYNYGPFYGCSNYPKCKNVKAISLNKDLYNTF
jgi:folate-dependent tRNA-U54 methylase TrmFO/GidA